MIKAYTDLEQSKKLASGILPPESADMYYQYVLPKSDKIMHNPILGNPIDALEWYNKGYTHFGKKPLTLNEYCIPCWSLAALLDILPTTIGNFFEKNALRLRIDKGENDFNIWYENFDCGDVAEGLDVIEDNPIDACYEMILDLHELKLL